MIFRMARRGTVILLTLITAAAASAQTAAPGAAPPQTVRVERPVPNIIELSGGTGPGSWRLRYGSVNQWWSQASVVAVSPTRAYVTHGPWLRLMDTGSGQTIGRWRFPHVIQQVAGSGTGPVNITFQMPPGGEPTSMTVVFDPAVGKVPQWDVAALITYRVAEVEAWQQLKLLTPTADPWRTPIPGAAAAVPAFRELVRLDPSGPWLRLGLAKLLRDAGDPGAAAAFADVMRATSNDYTEWFRVSGILAEMDLPDYSLAEAAFDRAFADFLRRDRDPRMVDTLVPRMILFPTNPFTSDQARRRWYLDHIYGLTPTSEATERAWRIHAFDLDQRGDPDATLWRNRSLATRQQSLFLATIDTQVRYDQLLLIALSSLIAAWLFFLTRVTKYGPQTRMRAAAAARTGKRRDIPFALNYWTLRERWLVLTILAVGWLGIGLVASYRQPLDRAMSLPVHAGSLNGYQDFERFPPSAERTLLQAVALQHVDRIEEAEKLYRSTPQFAESWNNLGVVLARAGKTEESRQAFARAQEIDPLLPEANFNTTGEARDPITETFRKYASDAKMIALPSRNHLLTAYLGNTWDQRFVRMFRGPFVTSRTIRELARFNYGVVVLPELIGRITLLIMLFASIVIFLVPRADATVPPGRWSRVLEFAIPGTATAWRWAGGVVLIAWTTVLVAVILQLAIKSPYLLTSVAQPGVMLPFGFQVGLADVNPPIALLFSFLIALWAANAALLLLQSRHIRS